MTIHCCTSRRLMLLISMLALLSLLGTACSGAATPTTAAEPAPEASLPASPETQHDHHEREVDHHPEDDGHHAGGNDHHESSEHHDDNGPDSAEQIAGGPEVRIVALEFGYEPSTLTIAAGQPVNIVLVNEGAVEHDLVADELGLHIHADGGETALAGFIPQQPGTYDFACSIPGHEEAGMTGQIVVK